MNCGIYNIVNKLNGCRYGGSSNDIKGRFLEHKNLLLKNKHHNKYLQNTWNKFKKQNRNAIFEDLFEFHILLYCPESELNIFEQIWLDIYWGRPNYNISKYADSPMRGRKTTMATRKKQSIAHKGKHTGKQNPMWGKCVSRDTRQKLRMSRLGKRATKESKEKNRLAHQGQNNVNSILNNKKIISIRELIKNGWKNTVIAKKFGVSHRTISAIRHGHLWSHIKS